jgi:hypothetical protein
MVAEGLHQVSGLMSLEIWYRYPVHTGRGYDVRHCPGIKENWFCKGFSQHLRFFFIFKMIVLYWSVLLFKFESIKLLESSYRSYNCSLEVD